MAHQESIKKESDHPSSFLYGAELPCALQSPSCTSGSASIPEASIPYRYRIVLVNIAKIDIVSIQYRFFTAFNFYSFKIFFSNFLVRRFHQNLFLKYFLFLNQNLLLHDLLPQNLLRFLKVMKRSKEY
jgi:hypothetical protein